MAAITVAGFPLMAVRQEDGSVKGFHNVCRHRAGPLVPDGQSQCDGRLTCLYHGWRYALDGRLASARDFGPAEGFDPRDYGLFALRCEIWRGFVFVNMDVNAAPLAQAIAPLEVRARGLSIERFKIAPYGEPRSCLQLEDLYREFPGRLSRGPGASRTQRLARLALCGGDGSAGAILYRQPA